MSITSISISRNGKNTKRKRLNILYGIICLVLLIIIGFSCEVKKDKTKIYDIIYNL